MSKRNKNDTRRKTGPVATYGAKSNVTKINRHEIIVIDDNQEFIIQDESPMSDDERRTYTSVVLNSVKFYRRYGYPETPDSILENHPAYKCNTLRECWELFKANPESRIHATVAMAQIFSDTEADLKLTPAPGAWDKAQNDWFDTAFDNWTNWLAEMSRRQRWDS